MINRLSLVTESANRVYLKTSKNRHDKLDYLDFFCFGSILTFIPQYVNTVLQLLLSELLIRYTKLTNNNRLANINRKIIENQVKNSSYLHSLNVLLLT